MKYLTPYRSIALLILISFVSLAPACPKQSDLDRLAKASRELAHDSELATDIVVELYKSNKLSLEAKDKALDKLGVVAKNGQKFHAILVELDTKYKDGNLPPDVLSFVRENFRLVSAPFYELLGELNLFGAGDAVKALKGDIETVEDALK